MRAMVLERPRSPLEQRELERPTPSENQVSIAVHACGVCRTDLHVIDGELSTPKLPLVLGHEIVGEVVNIGSGVTRLEPGQRVGVPWLGETCGHCSYCARGKENLCPAARFTGYTLDGGYAEYAVADERYCFVRNDTLSDTHAAPLLCAGLIGHRALAMAGDAEHIGLYGFGAAAHIIAQVIAHEGRHVYAFTRPGDTSSQRFAVRLGATWAGGSDERPPRDLDAALLFAPAGELVIAALRVMAPGGTVVCAGIHMSDIPSFPYELLWHERTVRSVANLTRADGEAFFKLLARVPLQTTVTEYALSDANRALGDLRVGQLDGAAVLVP